MIAFETTRLTMRSCLRRCEYRIEDCCPEEKFGYPATFLRTTTLTVVTKGFTLKTPCRQVNIAHPLAARITSCLLTIQQRLRARSNAAATTSSKGAVVHTKGVITGWTSVQTALVVD